ncbi:hypothetical protein VPH35_059807 [Triticum aestivum]
MDGQQNKRKNAETIASTPKGIRPSNASACEVGYKDSLVLRFFTCVTGKLNKGKLSEVEGIKTKILIWIKVTAVRTEASKVHFCAGLNKTRNRDAYEVVRDGVSIDKF